MTVEELWNQSGLTGDYEAWAFGGDLFLNEDQRLPVRAGKGRKDEACALGLAQAVQDLAGSVAGSGKAQGAARFAPAGKGVARLKKPVQAGGGCKGLSAGWQHGGGRGHGRAGRWESWGEGSGLGTGLGAVADAAGGMKTTKCLVSSTARHWRRTRWGTV